MKIKNVYNLFTLTFRINFINTLDLNTDFYTLFKQIKNNTYLKEQEIKLSNKQIEKLTKMLLKKGV